MKRRVYIYQNPLEDYIIELFSNINDNITVQSADKSLLILLDSDYYNPEPVNLESFQVLLEEDANQSITTFVEPYSDISFPLGIAFKSLLNELPAGFYTFEDIIPYVVLNKKGQLKKKIKHYIEQHSNKEVIHTVRKFIDNNMNSSESAKKLFMHRNTLNYRIDNFIEATHINVKTFKGANAMYMLYEY
ncbi:MAG: helix-turn-helix domain-containing protein [Candidatus Izimaplasma sp.]|nr:helix-turn-helix domain-containing protein [Candidatus Izimaplasma bacterium]